MSYIALLDVENKVKVVTFSSIPYVDTVSDLDFKWFCASPASTSVIIRENLLTSFFVRRGQSTLTVKIRLRHNSRAGMITAVIEKIHAIQFFTAPSLSSWTGRSWPEDRLFGPICIRQGKTLPATPNQQNNECAASTSVLSVGRTDAEISALVPPT